MRLVLCKSSSCLCIFSKAQPSSDFKREVFFFLHKTSFCLHFYKRNCHSCLPISVIFIHFNLLNSGIVLFRLHQPILISSSYHFFNSPFHLNRQQGLYSVIHFLFDIRRDYLLSVCCFPLIKSMIWKTISRNKATVFPYVMLFMTPAHWSGQSKPNESINRLWRARCHLMDIWPCQCSFEAGLDEHMHVCAKTHS